ncbi:MAG: hypothetical protein GXP45_01835 [bacterium]|nr:hypothetical protein [bacterium]
MQDSLEYLYQCFLWTAQFAESCRVYEETAKEEKEPILVKLFSHFAKQYSLLSGNFLQMFQEAKDQAGMRVDYEISTEL